MAAHEELRDVAPGEGPLDEFLAALQQGGTVDSQGVFTLDREKAREKMQRFQLAQPARYVLELVQAAVLRGATYISFEISATDVHMRCPASPFSVKDYEDLYESLFARGHGGQRQALRHLALGLCTAVAMDPKQIKVSGGGSQGASLLMRPGSRDKFGKGGEGEYGLHVHLQRRPWMLTRRMLGSVPMELIERDLLMDCCGLSMVPIELNGMPISSGYQLPGALYWQHFQRGNTRCVVAVAKGDAPYHTATSLHLMRNCISFEKDTPPGLLPGFLALVESPSFHLDISHQRIVRNEAFAQALMLVLEVQLQLLAASCDQLTRRAYPHPPALLRGLLYGLLDQLGSPDPLARWASITGTYPLPAPPQFPQHLPGAAAIVDCAVFPTVDKRMVSLRQILVDRSWHGSVAISPSVYTDQHRTRPLVLLAAQPWEMDICTRVFLSGRAGQSAVTLNHPQRTANIERWRKRRQEPKLLSPPNLLRVNLPPGMFAGEVAVELPASHEVRADSSTPSLTLTLLHQDGVLAVHRLPCPVRGLHAIIGGQFSPDDLWDRVLPDSRLSAAMTQLLQTLPILAAAIVLEWQSLPSSTESADALRQIIRGLFVMAGSELVQQSLHAQLGLRPDLVAAVELRRELDEILRTEQIANMPLFDSLVGPPLSLRDLQQEFERRGAIAVVACRSPSDPEQTHLRSRWALLFGDDPLPDELVARAVPRWSSSGRGVPQRIVWFEGPLDQLAQTLQGHWGASALEDARPALEALWQQHSRLREEAAPVRSDVPLAALCWATVPIPDLQGELGLLRDEHQHSPDMLCKVWLQRDEGPLDLTLCALPAGGLLVARVARRAVERPGNDARGDLDLARLRRSLHGALLQLCEALSAANDAPLGLLRRFYLPLITALFPLPAFRKNYERLLWQATRDGRAAVNPDREHRKILSLTWQHSVFAVHGVLQHALERSVDQPVTARMISHHLWHGSSSSAEATKHGEDGPPSSIPFAEPPGALDFLALFFPSRDPFEQRTLAPAPALQRAPLCQGIDGNWLTLGTILREVQVHGDVLYVAPGTSLLPDLASDRPLVHEQQDRESASALYCLLGDFRLRPYDAKEAAAKRAAPTDLAAALHDVSPPQALQTREDVPSAAGPRDAPPLATHADEHPPVDAEKDAEQASPTDWNDRLNSQARAVSHEPAEAATGTPADLDADLDTGPFDPAASTSDTIAALNRDASLWLRITHAAASLLDSLRPGQATRAVQEAQVLDTLFTELRLIAGGNSPLLSQINLSRIRFAAVASRQAVLCTAHQTLINRRHPAVKRALRLGPGDPVAIWFLCAAVYTALNVFFEEVTDADEAEFLALLCRRADSVLRQMAPLSTPTTAAEPE